MSSRSDLTFKHNLKQGRHGWLRLTPAYSIKVVHEILDEHPSINYVLDPFSGTGTTGLVCAERKLRCDLLDINPFLVWFARIKTSNFTPSELLDAKRGTGEVRALARECEKPDLWFPPIKDIDRWWSEGSRSLLARIYHAINQVFPENSSSKNILLVAFCRCLMEWSNAAFNHQSMSFKKRQDSLFDCQEEDLLAASFERNVKYVADSASRRIVGQVKVMLSDSRHIPKPTNGRYDCIITSPPYPNRMSYIRELRPYMYWLGYLKEARQAGELDWQAIGGTWGIATSRVGKWEPNGKEIKYKGFQEIIAKIAQESPVLANYVNKYFVDMDLHIKSVYPHLLPGAKLFYIVGNSKFYDAIVPVEKIYMNLFKQSGFIDARIEVLRKRNSKKELYEYLVSAQKPFDR